MHTFKTAAMKSFNKKRLRHRHIKQDRDKNWQDCSSKYASIDRNGFRIWSRNFKTATMMSFHK